MSKLALKIQSNYRQKDEREVRAPLKDIGSYYCQNICHREDIKQRTSKF